MKLKRKNIFLSNFSQIIFFKPFLRGHETTRKKYLSVFKIFWKYHFFSQKIDQIIEKMKLFSKFSVFFCRFSRRNFILKLFWGKTRPDKNWAVFEIFWKYFFFLNKSKKSMKKWNCSKFFDKNSNLFFFWISHKKCLETSSKGTENN